MTDRFKDAMKAILRGGSIAFLGSGKYRVRDVTATPVMTIGTGMYQDLIRHCRKKGNVWVINKKKILSYHGKSWVKKEYKKIRYEGTVIQLADIAMRSLLKLYPKTAGYTCFPCTNTSIIKFDKHDQERKVSEGNNVLQFPV